MESPVIMAADSQSDCNKGNMEELNITEIRQRTTHILNGLLETGECDMDLLFSMLKILSVHSSKMKHHKEKYKEKVNETENKLLEENESINLISKVFSSVKHPKVWDNFTKVQRRNIESWLKEIEITDGNCTKTVKNSFISFLDFYDADDIDICKSKRLRLDDEVQNSMSNEIIKLLGEEKMLRDELTVANEVKKKLERQLIMQKCRLQQLEAQENLKQEVFASYENDNENIKLTKEIHLISLISVFLSAHPFGANIHYICSYLNQFNSTIEARAIESLMKQFPSIFYEKCTGIGATLEKKWQFCDFKSI